MDHFRDLAEVHHVCERKAKRRVVREAIPVAAADRARKRDHGAFHAGRRVRPLRVHRVGVPQRLAVRGVIRGERVEVLRRVERVSRDGCRLHRKGLRGPRRFTRNLALRNRALFHPEDRFAGDPVEDEYQRHLRDDRNRRNRAAVALDVD